MAAIRVAIAGALGRMGREVARAIGQDGELALVAGVVRAHPAVVPAEWPARVPLHVDLAEALA
ncbi:MAG: 4-hydroxy-tetrahydrodipicolinate reductase, partial [Chloroflexi bacterium]|nr:4-hydroxy-tetrahydrodipicolinate reductase [Chloroflexota bacterium]